MSFVKDNWTQILWFAGTIITLLSLIYIVVAATRCSLRNDILTIYTCCKPTKTISLYQKQAIHMSADLYDKLHGNSFVKSIVEEIDTYKVV